jgi:predicted ester cyclase
VRRALVERFYTELWNDWQIDAAEEIVAGDFRFRGSFGTAISGREEFKSYVHTIRSAFPDWDNQIDELIECGDTVVARLTWTGTHRGRLGDIEPTGAKVRYVGAAFFRFRGDKICDAWVVGDTQELWRALGQNFDEEGRQKHPLRKLIAGEMR